MPVHLKERKACSPSAACSWATTTSWPGPLVECGFAVSTVDATLQVGLLDRGRTRFTSPRHVIDVGPPRSSQTRERHTSFHSLHTDDEIGSIASIHRRPVESHFR